MKETNASKRGLAKSFECFHSAHSRKKGAKIPFFLGVPNGNQKDSCFRLSKISIPILFSIIHKKMNSLYPLDTKILFIKNL